jgi:hypothetical protein
MISTTITILITVDIINIVIIINIINIINSVATRISSQDAQKRSLAAEVPLSQPLLSATGVTLLLHCYHTVATLLLHMLHYCGSHLFTRCTATKSRCGGTIITTPLPQQQNIANATTTTTTTIIITITLTTTTTTTTLAARNVSLLLRGAP